jgi:hypothetical protein
MCHPVSRYVLYYAPPCGAFQTRCADSTHPGQGHKCVFGRWHALRFLATRDFSSHASSRTNTSHRHGLNRLGAASEDTLFRNQDIRPSLILFCRLSSQIDNSSLHLSLSRMRQYDHPLSTTPFHTVWRPSPLPPRPWVLYPTSVMCHHTCVLRLSRGFHCPEQM